MFLIKKLRRGVRSTLVGLTLCLSLALAGCNVTTSTSIGVSRVHFNNYVKLSFHSLSGTINVGTITSNQQGKVDIPYTAKVGSGQLTLSLEDGNSNVLWNKMVTSSSKGNIILHGTNQQQYSIVATTTGTVKDGVITINGS